MEELTEVITATEFHPFHCNLFMYSSSKSSIKLADMRDSALCDKYAKCTLALLPQSSSVRLMSIHRLWRGRRSNDTVILLGNHFFHLRCKVQLRWTIYLIPWLSFIEDLGCQHGIKTHQDNSHSWPPAGETLWSLWEWLYLWQIRVRMGWRRQVRDCGSYSTCSMYPILHEPPLIRSCARWTRSGEVRYWSTGSHEMGSHGLISLSLSLTGTCLQVLITISSEYTIRIRSMMSFCKPISRRLRPRRLEDHCLGIRSWGMDRRVLSGMRCS